MRFPIHPWLRRLRPVPHGGAAALAREGLDPDALVDFSATVLPGGPPEPVRLAAAAAPLGPYPDPHAHRLRAALARRHGLDEDEVLPAAGSIALLRAVARATLGPGDTALVAGPTFGEYAQAARLAGATPIEVPAAAPGGRLDPDRVLDAARRLRPALIFLCSPNNPTGGSWPPDLMAALEAVAPVVLDEAYAGFLRPPPPPRPGPRRLVLRSMTKECGLAGLRVGWAAGPHALLRVLEACLDPWSLSAPAQAAALAALAEPAAGEIRRRVDALLAERDRLARLLAAAGVAPARSDAPFLLAEVGDARETRRRLLRRGLLVRECASLGLPAHVRISPRTAPEGDRLVRALAELTGERPGPTHRSPPTTAPRSSRRR